MQDEGDHSAVTTENPLAHSHALLWDGLPEPKRGPKPTLTLDEIVTAAIAVADREGIDGLSMRRLASELGMGTMSIYRYIPGKGELLNLMLDQVSAPPAAGPGEPALDWRATLEASAWGGRTLYIDHPWLLQINWTRPVLGPNALAGLELTMSGLAGMPFSDREKIMVITLLDAFVTGAVRQELMYESAADESDISEEEFWAYQLPMLERAMNSGAFPAMAAMAEDSFDAGWEETFAFGLKHLLDGFGAEVERRLGG